MTSAAGKPPLPVSPLATPFPDIPPVDGVAIGVGRAGFYARVRDDLVVIRFAPGAAAAGVFTRHRIGSAPVDWCQAALKASGGRARALVVNAGCANSFTGDAGRAAVRATVEAVAAELGCADAEVLAASTGVIGAPLQYGKILNVLQEVLVEVRDDAYARAARAIMTTDTFPKGAAARTVVKGRDVRLAGICKGSGMIAPDMATMLAFVFTDAAIAPEALRTLLSAAVARTLNAVTVDGDRSTNDTCLLFATGQAGNEPAVSAEDPDLEPFKTALEGLLLSLAHQLVRDGEGATKFVKVTVAGAESEASARKIARTICESPLVKTAIAGEDANWGRVAMAVGRADEPIARDKVSIRFGDLWAARDGAAAAEYSEEAMSAYMRRSELDIVVDVGVGDASAVMWTCDLTHGYVSINADYRS